MLAFAGSDTLTRDKMEKGTRDLIAKQMDVFMPKFPNASLQQIPFSFLLITWVNLCRIQVFKRLKYSTGREEFKTDLIYLLLTRLKG